MRILGCIVAICLYLPLAPKAQNNSIDSLPAANTISEKSLNFINKKYASLTDAVDRQTVKLLQRMQQKEDRIRKKLQKKDSSKAKELFDNSAAKYQQLQAKLQSPLNAAVSNPLKQYLPGMDSMGTAMNFLSVNKAISADKLAQIQGIGSQVQQLQGRMQQANEVQDFVRQREQQLKDQLSQYGLGKQLLGMNKEVYYYQQQLAQYKELVNDPEKLGEAILEKVRQLPAFQSFWQKNSMLAQLFPMPANYGTPAALAGLQTRAQVQSLITQRLPSGSGGTDPSQFLSQQFQQAQTQMNALKDKVSQLGGSGGSSDMTMPDFTPNSQHNKSFLKRLTYGFNLQNTSATTLLPAISTVGLSLGYKLSDKATIGTGVSYQLGLGRGLSQIALTNQGLGLRSYMDWKIPAPKSKGWEWIGSLWVTGGYEYNYMQAFAKLSDIRHNINVWQKSALLGITKKYKIAKKESNMQLLYDFLANKQIPIGQPVKFRLGYSF